MAVCEGGEIHSPCVAQKLYNSMDSATSILVMEMNLRVWRFALKTAAAIQYNPERRRRDNHILPFRRIKMESIKRHSKWYISKPSLGGRASFTTRQGPIGRCRGFCGASCVHVLDRRRLACFKRRNQAHLGVSRSSLPRNIGFRLLI